MRRLILALLCLALSGKILSQDYYMDAVNGQTITTCRGNVLPTWLCSSFGGYAGYCNNENYTVTFYSGNPAIPLKISFLPLAIAGFPTNNCFYTENGFDYLTIINGPAVGSPTLATLTGAIAGPMNYQSTGPYLTIKFKSDFSNNDWGWYAILGCQPQGCNGNLPASDVCSSAVAICDLNGYCGSTNGWYTPDNTSIGFCGSIENNSWIKFIPNSTSATIGVNVTNCASATQGLQAALYSTPNCVSFTSLACQSQATYSPSMSLTYNSFVPGSVYYVMIDGYAGNACDYTVTATGGVAVSTINATSSTICRGQSTTLNAAAAGSSPTYLWNTGATSSGITVSPTVTTAYSATISSGFCTEVVTSTVTVNPIPTANAGTSPASITCANPTQALGGSGGGSYSWTGPGGFTSASQNPAVTVGGNYNLAVTVSGCTSTNVATVFVPTNTTSPGASASASGSLNCTSTSINLNGGTTTGNSFSWTGPGGFTSTGQNPAVSVGGTYNLTVVNTANGCSSTANVAVAQNTTAPGATASALGTLKCSVTSITLNGGTTTGNSFSWTGPGGFTSTTQNPSVTQPGTYNLTVVNTANGCSSTANVAVTQNTIAPGATASASGSLNCTTTSINLNGGTTTGNSFSWTGPGGFSSTTQNPPVTVGGTYNLTVVNTANGCSSTANVAVTQNTTAPGATASASGSLNCTTTSINLTGGTTTGNSFSWTGPGGFTSSTQNPAVTVGGTYNLTVVNTANGCSSTSNVVVNQNTTLPGASASASGSLNCTATSINLNGSSTTGNSYSWTGPGGFTSTSQNPAVTVGGTYNLTVVSTANGCSSTANVAVTQNTTAPGASASALGTLKCSVTSITLNGGTTTGNSFSWTGPGGFTSTSQNPSVTQAGTYNLTVVNTANGCSSTANVAVTQNTTAPGATASASGSLNCTTTSINLTGGTTTGNSFSWSGPGGFTSTSQNPVATAGGTYNFTVINTANGCSSTASVSVTQNTTAPGATASSSGSLNCVSTSINLNGGTTTGNSYSWTGPGAFSSTSQNPSVTLGGTYNLTVVNTANGCSSTANVAVTQNTTAPGATASASGSLNCTTTSINLNGGTTTGNSFSWTGPGGFSSTGQNPSVSQGGTYNLTVINTANGCSSTANVSVTQNTIAPIATAAANGSLNCTNTSVTLNGGPATGVTYAWSGPGSFGSTSQNPVITVGGTYSLVVTSTLNNCPSTVASTTILQSAGLPSVTATASGSLNCQVTSTTVVLSTTATPVTYTWTGPGITNGNAGATATVNLGGSYLYTVTNTSNNCKVTGTLNVVQNTVAPTPTASTNGTITCATNTINLSGGPAGMSSYTWTAPAGSSVASTNINNTTGTGGGTYTLAVTSATNGCVGSTLLSIPVQTNAPVASIINNPTVTCTNSLVTLNGSPASGVTYTWAGSGISGSANNANVSVSSGGVYSLAVTFTNNGCTSVVPATINISSNLVTPTLSAASQTAALGCGSNSVVTLSGSANPAGTTYTWTSGAGGSSFSSGVNNSTVAVNSATSYTLSAAHPTTGCIATLVYTVQSSAGSPTVTASGSTTGTITCSNTTQSVSVSVNPSSGVTYSWSGPGIVGASNTSAVTASLAGSYNLVVTNTVNSCSTNSLTFVVSADNSPVIPNATTNNQTVTCTNSNATITTSPSPAGPFTYNWSDGSSTSSITVAPTTNTNYVVTVTNTANGCTGSQTINITANVTPPSNVNTSASSVTLSCANPNTTLTGSAAGASTYSWIAPGNGVISTTTTAGVNSPGTYSFIAVGSNGCASSSSAAQVTVVADSNAPVPVLSNSSPSIVCNNNPALNSTTLTGTNMTGASYSWSPSSGVSTATSNIVTFIQSGTYTCVITGTNGCVSSTVVSVSDASASPSPVGGTITAQPISCTNSVVAITPVFNPNNDLTFVWTGTGIVGSTTSGSVQVNQPGSYSLTVTNTLTGCSSPTPFIIPVTGSNIPPTLTVSSSSSLGISCQPNSSTVTLDAQSGSAVTYSWSTGATTSSISTSSPGVYSVSVTDNNSGCVTASTIAVQNNTIAPNLTSSASGNLPCGSGSASLSASSSNTNVSYSWFGAGIVSGSNTASPLVNIAGVYTVTALDNVTGCSSTSTVSISQTTVSALAAADATTGPAPLNVNFTNQSLGATSYSWSFGDGNSSIATNPSNSFLNAGTYTIVLVSTNGACSANDTLIIKVQTALGVIPEVFTPNGDGKNDVFVIDGIDSYPNNNFQVFNRWGNPVYSAKPYKNDWNATPNVSGAMGSGKLPSGTYFYLLELNDKDKTIFKGFIQIQY